MRAHSCKRRALSAFIAAAVLFVLFPINAHAEASGSCVYEVGSERMLFGENEDAKLPMASTTKIMTCLVALENSKLDEVVTVDAKAAGIEGSSMYLRAGETITMQDLLLGLMLASGNDAACAIAIHIAGSVEEFCKMMNEKANEIGAVNTHFVTPNGLHDDEHYTTAKDLGLIACHAMKNEVFKSIVSKTNADLKADEDSPARYLRSKNKILYQYEGGNGVKTGYTKAAGKCLVAGAERDGMQLVSVVLNDYDMFKDSMALLDKGFENYTLLTVLEKAECMGQITVEGGLDKSVGLVADQEIRLPLAQNEFNMINRKVCVPDSIAAPVKKGQKIGSVEIYFQDELIASADLTAEGDVFENSFLYHFGRVIKNWIHERGNIENSEIFGVGRSSLET